MTSVNCVAQKILSHTFVTVEGVSAPPVIGPQPTTVQPVKK